MPLNTRGPRPSAPTTTFKKSTPPAPPMTAAAKAQDAADSASVLGAFDLADKPASSTTVTPRGTTYPRTGGEFGFFQDILRAKSGDSAAGKRLETHERENALTMLRRQGSGGADARELRAIGIVAGAGAEFSPPAWMVFDAALAPRAGRAFVDTWTRLPLPPGVSVIDIPRITTGSTVAAQTAQNAPPSTTDLVTSSLAAPVITIAGIEDMSLQLFEQGPSHDYVIYQDLVADYNAKLSVQALNGSGSSGQALGVLNVTGITSTAFTTGSPTVLLAWPRLATALAAVHTSRFMPPTAVVMHGRRWAWFLDALDSNSRPFITSSSGPDEDGPDGQAGRLFGLPVIVDDNVPVTLGAGANQDAVIFARTPDLYIYEGGPRLKVSPSVLSGTLGVRLELIAYVAIAAGRLPTAVSVVAGTGLTPPSM